MENCGGAKIELHAFCGNVGDLEISREKCRVATEESECLRQDLAQQLEFAKEQNKRLEERNVARESEQEKSPRR